MEKPNILVVDDDQIVLESCRSILQGEGFNITLVSSAQEAIVKLGEKRYTLLLMDVKMARFDGIYLLKTIQEKWPLKDYPEIPVLVMSGYPTPETINLVKSYGAKNFIAKPFTPDELMNLINQILIRHKKNHERI